MRNDELITVVHKPCLASNLGDCDHVMLTQSYLGYNPDVGLSDTLGRLVPNTGNS